MSPAAGRSGCSLATEWRRSGRAGEQVTFAGYCCRPLWCVTRHRSNRALPKDHGALFSARTNTPVKPLAIRNDRG